jgi:hypothetical protein
VSEAEKQDIKKQKQNTGEVEDEIHFLFNCSKYEPDRKELVDIILTSCPNLNSYIFVVPKARPTRNK